MRKKVFKPLYSALAIAAVFASLLFDILIYDKYGVGLPLYFVTILGLIIFQLLAFILAGKQSEHISRAIYETDPSDPYISEEYPELSHFAEYISQQRELIKKQFASLQMEYHERELRRKELTANVSHELKTPLTSISGYAEIMKAGVVKEEDISRFAGKIYDEAQRLVVMVNDMLMISSLDEGKVQEKFVEVDLYAKCAEIMHRHTDQAAKRGITLSLEGERAVIMSTNTFARELISNLLDNAIKYNVDDGAVAISVRSEDREAILTVSDTGIGMEGDDKYRAFERFYRSSKTPSEIAGTGLGLSIVKHIAAFHNAQIELESEPGKGTTISVAFPL